MLKTVVIGTILAAVFISSIFGTYLTSYSLGYNSGYNDGTNSVLVASETVVNMSAGELIIFSAFPAHGNLNGTITVKTVLGFVGTPTNNSVNIVLFVGDHPSTGWFRGWDNNGSANTEYVGLAVNSSVSQYERVQIYLESNSGNTGNTIIDFLSSLTITYDPNH